VYCKLERVMNCRGRSRSYGCMSETESRTRRERRGLGLRRTSPHAVTPDSGQRRHELPQVFNAVRWIVRAGAPWRVLPNDFPPWEAVSQQTQRWLAASGFEAMVPDLRALLRLASKAPCSELGLVA
jgi:transposase